MTSNWMVVFVLVAKPWEASQAGIPGTRQTTGVETTGDSSGEMRGGITTPNLAKLSATTVVRLATANKFHASRFAPTDRPPTFPVKELGQLSPNEVAKQKLGEYYRTVYTGNGSKTLHFNGSEPPDGESPSADTVTHISGPPPTTVAAIQEQALPPGGYGANQRQGFNGSRPTKMAGPYFRPPSAISHKYKNFRIEPGDDMADIDPDCWPHCRNTNSTRSWGNKRKRKHSSFKKRKYYNYKLLYDTLKGDLRRQETEFYAWIFGATMLTLGSLTTLTSCFVFCFCGEKWRKRRQTRKYDKSGQYQRVDSVSSMVDNMESQDPQDQLDSVTII